MIIGLSGKKQSGKDTVAKIIQLLITFPKISNKDIINKYLIPNDNILGNHWKIKRFASKLKEIVAILTGYNVEDLEKEDIKNASFLTTYNVPLINAVKIFTTIEEAMLFVETRVKADKSLYDSEIPPHVYDIEENIITPRKLLQVIGTNIAREIHPDIWVNSLMKDYTEDSNWIIPDVRFLNETVAIKDKQGIIIRVNRSIAAREGVIPADDKHPSETALDNYRGFTYTIDNNDDYDRLIDKVKEILIQEKLLTQRTKATLLANETEVDSSAFGTRRRLKNLVSEEEHNKILKKLAIAYEEKSILNEVIAEINNPKLYDWVMIGNDKYGRKMYCLKTGKFRHLTMGEFYEDNIID